MSNVTGSGRAEGDHVLSLLSVWYEGRRNGVEPSPEELCPEDLAVRGRLEERIAAVKRLDALLGGASTEPSSVGATLVELVAADQIPGYEIYGVLGRGGMGEVYFARQISLNRFVALKMIRDPGRAGPKAPVRFLAEAEAVAAVRHPHIVQVYEYGEHAGRAYLSLECLSGGSLADRLGESDRLGPRETAELLEKVASGVAAAHRLGIIHRDLKPGNVLFDEHGEPKVTDFGLAKRDLGPDLTHTGAVLGTPAYMAPEQADSDKFVGPQADVWALGAILYRCLTGRRPFDGATPLEILDRVRNREPQSIRALTPAVPRDLETVCLKCLAKDPRERYPTARELADDLARFRAGRPVTARPAGAGERAVKWIRRNPMPTAIMVLLVAGLALVSYLFARAVQAESNSQRAELDLRQELTRSYVRQAELAMQRGKWEDAREDLQRALDEGHPDSNAVRLELARVLYYLNHEPEAIAELDQVEQSPQSDGRTLLIRADLALGVDNEAALEKAAAALAKVLPPAEAAYARALISKDLATADVHYRAALAHQPYHLRANQLRAWGLLLMGRLDEARQQLAAARALFPDDPDLLFLEAMVPGFTGGVAEAKKRLADDRIDPNRRRFGIVIARLYSELRNVEECIGSSTLMLVTRLSPILLELPTIDLPGQRTAAPASRIRFILPPPFVKLFEPILRDLLADGNLIPGLMRLLLHLDQDRVDDLVEGFQVLQDGSACLFRGMNLRYSDPLTARELLILASTRPSLLNVRTTALMFLVTLEWRLARSASGAEKQRWTGETLRHLRELYATAGLPRVADESRLEELIVIALQAGDLELCRRLASDFHARFPKQFNSRRALAFAEYNSGMYGPALARCEELLREHPRRPDLLDLLSRIRKAIVHQAAAIPESAPAPRRMDRLP